MAHRPLLHKASVWKKSSERRNEQVANGSYEIELVFALSEPS